MSLSTLAALGMAIGAPLVYADQAYSIYRKQDARGFSHDVCAVLLIANITRCFFWLGERFEFALLLQSLLMIAAQLGLLYLCIRFKPVTRWSTSISSDGARVVFNAPGEDDEESGDAPHGRAGSSAQRDLMDLQQEDAQEAQERVEEGYANKQPLLVTLGAMFRGASSGANATSSYGRLSSTDPSSYSNGAALPQPTSSSATSPRSRFASILSHLTTSSARPFNFWQWSDYNSYLVFLLLLCLVLLLLYLLFSWSTTYIALLGYIALGLESTLPIPQLIANYRRKSLVGFRTSVLVGWLGGDSFKLMYFLLRKSPVQFTSCAVFQLSVDLAILAQSRLYRDQTEKDEEEMSKKHEAKRTGGGSTQASGRSAHGEIEEDAIDELPASTARSQGNAKGKGKGKGKGRVGGGAKREPVEDEEELLQGPHHVIAIEADDDDEGDISNGRRT